MHHLAKGQDPLLPNNPGVCGPATEKGDVGCMLELTLVTESAPVEEEEKKKKMNAGAA